MVCVRTTDGAAVWRSKTSDRFRDGPRAARGLIFLIGETGVLRVFRQTDGEPMWSYDAKSKPSGPILVADGIIMITGEDRWIHAIGIPRK